MKIDPAARSIVDGRLYLNYERRVQETWTHDKARCIAEADRNWRSLDAGGK